MSVQVAIDIGQGSAKRHLHIELTSDPQLDKDGHRDLDEVGNYTVILGGHHRKGTPEFAEFQHRYGDDVFTLITKAVDALRAAGAI